jgi:hypothetical protein
MPVKLDMKKRNRKKVGPELFNKEWLIVHVVSLILDRPQQQVEFLQLFI